MKRNRQVIDMHKWFVILAAVFLLGDPSLGFLMQIQDSRDYLIALTVSFFAAPWVVAQFDN